MARTYDMTERQRAYATLAHRLQRELVKAQRVCDRYGTDPGAGAAECAALERARNIAARLAWGKRGYQLTVKQARSMLPRGWEITRHGGDYILLHGKRRVLVWDNCLRLVNYANHSEAEGLYRAGRGHYLDET